MLIDDIDYVIFRHPDPLAEGRDAGGREVERLWQGEQDGLENLSLHARFDC